MTTTHRLSSPASTTPPPAVRGFADTRKGPIPATPAAPTWKGPVGTPKGDAEQHADALLTKFSKGVMRPDAARPDTLFAVGRSGRPYSLLVTFCRAASAKAHGFLVKVLLPAVENLAQRMDVAQPVAEKDPIDWKRAAGGHLIAGANAALQANNAKALQALVPTALKHFPDDVMPFIESRLKRNPATAKTFAAAGVDPATLKALLAKANAPAGERPAVPVRAPAATPGAAPAPAPAQAVAPAPSNAPAPAPAAKPTPVSGSPAKPAGGVPAQAKPDPALLAPTVEF